MYLGFMSYLKYIILKSVRCGFEKFEAIKMLVLKATKPKRLPVQSAQET